MITSIIAKNDDKYYQVLIHHNLLELLFGWVVGRGKEKILKRLIVGSGLRSVAGSVPLIHSKIISRVSI